MSSFESFRAVRWLRTLNLVLQAVLFLTLSAGLNYLARNHPLRYDLTAQRRYSLSPETLSYLRNLDVPITIIATLADDSNSPEVRGLLAEYEHATEANPHGPITVKYLDVNLNRRQAENLGLEKPDVIFLTCGENHYALTVEDLYRTEKKNNLPSVRTAFRGEQALTAAILDVSNPKKKKIYFLTGHGELPPDGATAVDPTRGLSMLRNELRVRNFAIDTLELSAARKVPADADLLIAVSPLGKFTTFEQELLRAYLRDRAGRLILFLAQGKPHGLEDLFGDWGILVDDDYVMDTGSDNMTDDGDLILRAYDPTHPITQPLVANAMPLRIGPARTVRVDPGRASGNGLTTTTLAATSTTAWGEISYRALAPAKDRGVDILPLPGMEPKDRLGVIVAAERVTVRPGLAFSVPTGRLVVFGNGDLVSNKRIADIGHFEIFLSTVNWTVDLKTEVNITARPIQRFQLSLSASDLLKLRYSLLLVLPGLAAALGLLVYWTRRH